MINRIISDDTAQRYRRMLLDGGHCEAKSHTHNPHWTHASQFNGDCVIKMPNDDNAAIHYSALVDGSVWRHKDWPGASVRTIETIIYDGNNDADDLIVFRHALKPGSTRTIASCSRSQMHYDEWELVPKEWIKGEMYYNANHHLAECVHVFTSGHGVLCWVENGEEITKVLTPAEQAPWRK